MTLSARPAAQRDDDAQRPPRTDRRFSRLLNLPNQLTSLRLLLSVALFCLIAWERYMPAFVLFVVAAGTDWLDGYYARNTAR